MPEVRARAVGGEAASQPTEPEMRILITGITGRVGANVARHFLERGDEVRGLVWERDPQAAKMARVGAEIVPGDLSLFKDVRRAADGREAIFHLGAAFQAGGPFTPEQYFDTNLKGTFNVLEAALELGDDLKHVISVSTDATMDKYPPGGMVEPITETSLPLSATHWYGYTKVLGENLVDRYARHEGLRATVFRFPMAFAAAEILKSRFFRLRHYLEQFEGRADPVGRATLEALSAEDDGTDRLLIACDESGRPYKKHLIDVRDLVHAFDAAAGRPATYGNVYQLGAPEPLTWDDAVPRMASVLNLPYSRVNLAGANPTYYEYDLSAARRDFGFDPGCGTAEMIDEAARHLTGDSDAVIPTRVR